MPGGRIELPDFIDIIADMKKIKFLLFFVVFIFCFPLLSCSSIQHYPESCLRIEKIPGPEDFVWLEDDGIFLISSYNRRDLESLGEIFSYNPQAGQLQIVRRINEPENLSFRPHGIDYFKPYLFVILHGNTLDTRWHAVAIYEYKNNGLVFQKLFQHPLIHSPNDLKVISEGEFFITNDMKTHNSYMEYLATIFLGIYRGSIVYCNTEKSQCHYVYEGIGFPNSIAIMEDKLFVSATLENKIYEFRIVKRKDRISLTHKKEIARIPGPDNLILYQEKIYTTSHPSMWKFIRHSSNAESPSPSLGYEIDPVSYKVQKIFEDSGERISASSVLLKKNADLFIGQVFDSFLLRCKFAK